VQVDGNDPHWAACIRSDELRGQDRYEAGEVFEATGTEFAIPEELVRNFEEQATSDNAALQPESADADGREGGA
jgi:hypothetical protein